MNRDSFKRMVAEKHGKKLVEVDEWLNIVLDEIMCATVEYDGVQFVGFGKFEKVHKGERMATNPQNPQEKVKVAEKDVPKFKPGREFKMAVKG